MNEEKKEKKSQRRSGHIGTCDLTKSKIVKKKVNFLVLIECEIDGRSKN